MLKTQALSILQTLEANGFEAYFVGGCVRDWLLGRSVHDIDICTDAHPSDVMQLFPNHYPTGLQHGTVSVKQGTEVFEVTTYRTDGVYEDFRRPKEVVFVNELMQDLQRRDFTINAMAMDRHDRLIDPFCGQDDLNNRLIRAVGDPLVRFREDALRLLRAARFASQLDFRIEAATYEAMKETAPLLAHVAMERIRDELVKLLDSVNPKRGCEIVTETNLLHAVPVEYLTRLFAAGEHCAWRLEHLGSIPQKWSLLAYASQLNADEVRQLCQSLRMSKKELEAIVRFVDILHLVSPKWDQPKRIEWGKLLLEHGWSVCIEVDNLLQACWWKAPDGKSTQELIDTYSAMPVKTVKELAINGRELQESLQKKAGEWIQHILSYLLEQTALNGLANTPDDLLEAAKKEVERYEHQTGNS